MDKEKVQAAIDDLKAKQDLFLLSMLEEEYNELSDKCNKLYKFIYSLDFKEKVTNSYEQCLLQEQHRRMEAYRTNLYQRIQFYRARIKANKPGPLEIDTAIKEQENLDAANQRLIEKILKWNPLVYAPGKKCEKCGKVIDSFATESNDKIYCLYCKSIINKEETEQALEEYKAACAQAEENDDGLITLEQFMKDIYERMDGQGRLKINISPCSHEMDEQINNCYKNYCRAALEKFLNGEITWGKYIDKMRLPFCGENLVELVKAGDKPDECNHCGQDADSPRGRTTPHFDPNESQPVNLDDACCQAKNNASCPVGDGSAVVKENRESLKRLVGMQVVAVNDVPCSKCVCGAGYTPSGYPLPECIKVELVGGYYLCLADLHNSIVTE